MAVHRPPATKPAIGDGMSRWNSETVFNRRMLICVFTGLASGMPLYVLLQLVPHPLHLEVSLGTPDGPLGPAVTRSQAGLDDDLPGRTAAFDRFAGELSAQ